MNNKTIAIDETNRDGIIGNVIFAMVSVSNPFNFFREHKSSLIMNADYLCREERDNIVKSTQTNPTILHTLGVIKPVELENKDNLPYETLKELETEKIADLLMTEKDFWKCRLVINIYDSTKEEFIERIKKYLPARIFKLIKFEKCSICQEANKKFKACSLASIYAKSYSDFEMDQIRKVYDIGSSRPNDPKTTKFILDNKDNPLWFIRRDN